MTHVHGVLDCIMLHVFYIKFYMQSKNRETSGLLYQCCRYAIIKYKLCISMYRQFLLLSVVGGSII